MPKKEPGGGWHPSLVYSFATSLRISVLHFGYLAEGERWEAKQDSYHRIAPVVADGYSGDHRTQKCSSGP
jgi:hypothetical protein